jgi:hypothetical protein
MDFSTINLDVLTSLKKYNLPSYYHLQEDSRNGCSGDAPGFPTYFTRNVYNKFGNTPSSAPQYVITYQEECYIVMGSDDNYDQDHWHQVYMSLWKPLPLEHERTRLWIVGTYKHHQHCYNGHGDSLVIFPTPYYKLKTYRDDVRWKDEYREAAKAEVEAFNKQKREQDQALATPENHNAVRIIRNFYPDYQPELDLINNPPKEHVGMWWETEAVQPSEQDCARSQRWAKRHPMNGSWCQWCGRSYPKEVSR